MTVHTSKGLEFPHVAVAELKDGYPGGRAPSFFVENIGETTYVAATWMPHGPWDKTASKLKGWARTQEAEDLDVSLDGPAEAERAFGALSAAQFGAALAAYSAAQEREEARRLMYVALTRASRSLLLAMRVSAKVEDGYESTWVIGDVFDALGWTMDDGASVAMMDFGGRAPARVASERVLAEAGEETGEDPLAASAPTGEERLDEELGAAVPLSEDAPAVFAVARRAHGEDPALAPRNFAREGLYSYTSLSGAHPHSDEPAVEADEGVVLLHEGRSGLGSETSNGSDESESSFVDDASGSRESDGSPACVFGAQESATALGTAFHRLAQQAIECSERGSLFAPSETAIRAQIQKEGLSEEQQARLRAALARWLGSDEAARFAAFENRRAEVPFTVAIGNFFLEGEIDGLADNGDGAAFLIDYKTGGRADETPEQLDERHRLQASCYAYALMRAGYESVDAHFLRIEHAAADNSRDPQIVPYHFEKTDLSALEALIIDKQKEATL